MTQLPLFDCAARERLVEEYAAERAKQEAGQV